MSEFASALLTYGFLQKALIAGLLASLGCGIMGSFVVVKRIGYLAGGMAHALLGGMGIAYFLGHDPVAGALVAALVVALIIAWVTLRLKEREDTIISAIWAIGMAVGILFISRTPGYDVDLMSYLFGNILLVQDRELWLIGILDGVILLSVALLYKQFVAVAFDEEFAALRGVPVALFHVLMLCLVALTVVMLIQVVGLILLIALLTLPAAIASQPARTLLSVMVGATALGMVFTTSGVALSFLYDLPAGATIVLVAGITYVLALAVRRLRDKTLPAN